MSKWIRWFKHNESIYPEVGQMPLKDLESVLKGVRKRSEKGFERNRGRSCDICHKGI